MQKTQLKGFSLKELEQYVLESSEKRFRARQLYHWMYKRKATQFDEMTDISASFRQHLRENADLNAVSLELVQESATGDAKKYLFRLHDGHFIESVLMLDGKRRTLCISTQVGCAIDCKFCATGAMGLKRNLTSGEIVDQVLTVARENSENITNVVVMGMGEPMHNYNNMMQALEIISDSNGLNISKRHIVVSTSGLVSAIHKFKNERKKYRLAISLNATTDAVRTRLMPLNKKWPIKMLLDAARDFAESSRDLVTIEYVLLAGINDSVEDARRLRNLLRGIRCKLNLIPYNTTMRHFRRPDNATIEKFFAELKSLQAPVTVRWSKGVDIDAACGQLATQSDVGKGHSQAQ
ncbi:MAG: 23S rRNA (adenine(2503)-C(2))-methyltransferase RlmN [bacterium]